MHAPTLARRIPLLVLPLLYSCGGENADAASFLEPPLGLEFVSLNVPDDNPLTAEKIALGKTLFFDTRLSSKGEMSCQSCHKHELGWSDGIRFSTKENGTVNTRNSPSLYNVGYQPHYYWDGRAPTMEINVAAAWKGHMGGDPVAMAAALAEIPEYQTMFQTAFGEGPSEDTIVKALTSFVRTLRSGNSAFDRGVASEDAKKGHELFMNKAGCGQCHTMPLVTDMAFHNVGVGIGGPDQGRGAHDPSKPGAFKTPSLRSVSKTAPYFHDGSVETLEEAVRFMVKGGGENNPNRDPLLMPKDLTEEEIQQLIAFLESLTSTETFIPPTLPGM